MMNQIDEGDRDGEERLIRSRALARIAQVFSIPQESISQRWEFGADLRASFVSDFRFNEFDKLDQDVKDVADKVTRKRLGNGELVIRTVADYCDHMVASYAKNPREVAVILGLDESSRETTAINPTNLNNS
jgi:hypothetical protein